MPGLKINHVGFLCYFHLQHCDDCNLYTIHMLGIDKFQASTQVPDKPALAWVACPGILHRS